MGCRRSWQQGLSACTNRLTFRMKVAEPIVFARLQTELQKPATTAYLVKAVEKALRDRASNAEGVARLTKQLEQERRKLDNLVAAVEAGSDAPAAVLRAITTRETTISELEDRISSATAAKPQPIRDLPVEISRQLADVAKVLKGDDPARVKAALCDLNFKMRFIPTDAQPHPHYIIEAQCDLSALGFLSVRVKAAAATLGQRRSSMMGARLVLLGEQAAAGTVGPMLPFDAPD